MPAASMIALLLVSATAPTYAYREATIELELPAIHRGTEVTVAWRTLDRFGRSNGRWNRRLVPNLGEDGKVEIEVGTGGGHELRISSDRGTHRIWATRGTWYALPRENLVSIGSRATPEGMALATSRDIILSGAFSVEVKTVRSRGYLVIGRTLGMDLGAAVRPPAGAALVIVGGATQQGIVVTLTERRPKDQVRYWDYSLNFSKQSRRHVIPLSHFRRRDGMPGKMRRFEAITIRTVRLPAGGDRLFVDGLALLESPPRIASIGRAKDVLSVKMLGRDPRSAVILTDAGTKTAVGTKKRVRLIGDEYAKATRVWLCYREEDVEACDPPDAPATAHRVPVAPRGPLLVDDFAGAILVNALRLRTQVYTSSIGLDPTLVSVRKPGSILLGGIEERKLDYAGYRTPLPPKLPRHLRRVELTIRGDADPELIKVGLRDREGGEPKVSLESYLPKLTAQSRTIAIPLAAFGSKLANLDSITVTLEASPERKQSLEIERIELSPLPKDG